MRKIKFRAWDKDNNKWLNNMYHKFGWYVNPMDGLYVSTGWNSCDEPTDFIKASDKFILMQYTGLDDKNGVEIYEGDILKFDSKEWGADTGNIFVVKWNGNDGEWSTGGGTNSECKEWKEVIGNIYENDDKNLGLLKGV